MYKDHKLLEFVSDDVIIWQYMCLSKFIDLLKEKKIYLNRLDNYPDKQECTLTAIDKKLFKYDEDTKAYWDRERKRYFVSCWVESNYELALMWDTYGKGGVAIKTTVGNLKQSLAIDKEHIEYLARVCYLDKQLDSSQEPGSPLNILKIPLSKRKYYEQEQEIRLLYFSENDSVTGHNFPIDIELLIEEVLVYPNAPEYFLKVVNQILKECGLKLIASHSKI